MKVRYSEATVKREAAKRSICELCGREVAWTSRHHLVPKSEGGTATAMLCSACHRTLHKFFTNRTLAQELYTIDSLRHDPEIVRYLKWIRKQPDRVIRVHENKKRR